MTLIEFSRFLKPLVDFNRQMLPMNLGNQDIPTGSWVAVAKHLYVLRGSPPPQSCRQ